jgi:hypothetical protein
MVSPSTRASVLDDAGPCWSCASIRRRFGCACTASEARSVVVTPLPAAALTMAAG